MIKSNELRLGNYYDQFGNIHQATWVTIKELSQAPEGQLWCKPIPLTEDWLVKFGFEDQDWIISHKKIYFNLFKQGDNYFFTADQHHHNSEPIKYVHQLQNLYFALTQTELTPSDGGKIEPI